MTSRANYWGGLALDSVASVAAIVAGFVLGGLAAGGVAVLCGMLWYSLAEYAIHRWVYHHGTNVVAALHDRHHTDPAAIYGPPFYYGAAIALVHCIAAAAFASPPAAVAFGGAVLLGYAQEGVIHHATHRYPHLDVLGARSMLRRHHAIHHLGGDANFGVSTTLWDRVFGTLR